MTRAEEGLLYRKRHPERCRESQRKWIDANKEKRAAIVARWRQEHPEYAAWHRETHRLEYRAASAKWKAEHTEECKAYTAKWRADHPEAVARIAARYRERNPEKTVAHNAVSSAIQSGGMSRGPCEECGVTENIHGHHDDYSKPLDVRWLCCQHHRSIHKEGAA